MQFNLLTDIIYNVYPHGSGEIIAGRVMSYNGDLLPGAKVTATAGGQTYNAKELTNDKGIYAIPKVPSNTDFTVSVFPGGTSSTPRR